VIIDAFLANDELELVQLRISYLSTSVDAVFIGEAVETFSGKSKTLRFHSLHDGKKFSTLRFLKRRLALKLLIGGIERGFRETTFLTIYKGLPLPKT
jgi:hypothetical protein